MSRKHIAGKPVSNSTYRNHGCRCDGCRTAATKYQKLMRTKGRTRLHMKAHSRAMTAAVKAFRQLHPELWDEILDDAKRAVGIYDTPDGRMTGLRHRHVDQAVQ